jgi:hypothetical protein
VDLEQHARLQPGFAERRRDAAHRAADDVGGGTGFADKAVISLDWCASVEQSKNE